MAKSIYEILDTLETDTSVPGHGQVDHTLPRNLFPDAITFENEPMLIEWAQNNNCMHACLQKGIQKFLIELRATFKACKKEDTWSIDYGQKNVNAMEWTITKRPNTGNKELEIQKAKDSGHFAAGVEMANNLRHAAKLDDATIKLALIPVYGETITAEILSKLEA